MADIGIALGAGFGDSGKGVQTYKIVFDTLKQLGVYEIEDYTRKVLEDPFQVLRSLPVLFNYVPFGGGNAGHDLQLENGKDMDIHYLPVATLFAPYTISMMGMRKNVHLGLALTEIERARKRSGADIVWGKTLFIDKYATITTDQDIALDEASTKVLRGTKKGNGPAMAGRAARYDVRAGDLFHLDHKEVRGRIIRGIREKNALLQMYGKQPFSEDQVFTQLNQWAQGIGEDAIQDGNVMMTLARANEEARIFITAPHGFCLDNDEGTIGWNVAYPIGPADIIRASHLSLGDAARAEFLLVKKAYETRAGSGPFPGEFQGEQAVFLQRKGKEIGVTSHNKRRTGPDNVAEAAFLASLIGMNTTQMAIPKMDIYALFMERFGPQRAIIGYRRPDGEEVTHVSFPWELEGTELLWSDEYQWDPLTPKRKREMVEKGWPALDEGMKEYLLMVARQTNTRISAIGLGRSREDIVTTGLYEETNQIVKV